MDIKLNVEKLKQMGTQINRLNCVGGVSKSNMLMQIKADVMGKEVVRMQNQEAGTGGLAMLCFVALGVFDNYNQAAKTLVATETTFTPNAKNASIYKQRYAQYARAYNGLKYIYTGEGNVVNNG